MYIWFPKSGILSGDHWSVQMCAHGSRSVSSLQTTLRMNQNPSLTPRHTKNNTTPFRKMFWLSVHTSKSSETFWRAESEISAKFRSRIFGDAFGAVMGGTGGVAWCHLRGLGTRYDIKIKTENFFKNTFFSMKLLFSKKYENRKFSKKSHFSKKKYQKLIVNIENTSLWSKVTKYNPKISFTSTVADRVHSQIEMSGSSVKPVSNSLRALYSCLVWIAESCWHNKMPN